MAGHALPDFRAAYFDQMVCFSALHYYPVPHPKNNINKINILLIMAHQLLYLFCAPPEQDRQEAPLRIMAIHFHEGFI